MLQKTLSPSASIQDRQRTFLQRKKLAEETRNGVTSRIPFVDSTTKDNTNEVTIEIKKSNRKPPKKLQSKNEVKEKASRQSEENQKTDFPPNSRQREEDSVQQAAAGCFHVCKTLIFEVYQLLGGNICKC